MSARTPASPRRSSRRGRLLRPLLGVLAAGMLVAPAIGAGCAAGFTPPSEIETLRIFAVTASQPYAQPGDEVTLTMSYHDGLIAPDESARPIQIVWLRNCINPPGDQYYGCYPQLAELFAAIGSGQQPPPGTMGIGPEFTFNVREDILDNRERPEVGPLYGTEYVFFVACAGRLGPVQDPGGRAGSFPIGCFDDEGRRLGADSFIPGYTQIYAFDDGRTNENPVATGIRLNDEEIVEDFSLIPSVPLCPIPEEERRMTGCSAADPIAECTTHELNVIVDRDRLAEIDPDGETLDGKQLTEVVWVNYYTDQGELRADTQLVNDAVNGFNPDTQATWIPPPEPGIATIWAVLRDARGGSSVVQRRIRVE
ncbi:hypothetical protein [Chondromyces crocatus]|uniref:Uncharacterized protein n=1 Tax=Chondromyces crocatus TaxID=52 RepID=A0A0K1EM73_CHOCO|nr:hypothetical protein [Chondromyces crocatus]AKT41964.1 uncharacterized protein CMC5_061860 [Chondromyces crocatus]